MHSVSEAYFFSFSRNDNFIFEFLLITIAVIQAKQNKKNAILPVNTILNKEQGSNPTSIASTIISSTITAPIQSVGADMLHRPPTHQLHHGPSASSEQQHGTGGIGAVSVAAATTTTTTAPHIISTRLELPILMDPLNANNYLISI